MFKLIEGFYFYYLLRKLKDQTAMLAYFKATLFSNRFSIDRFLPLTENNSDNRISIFSIEIFFCFAFNIFLLDRTEWRVPSPLREFPDLQWFVQPAFQQKYLCICINIHTMWNCFKRKAQMHPYRTSLKIFSQKVRSEDSNLSLISIILRSFLR